eukprot:395212-Prorocentrum_minimum.AAC.3
MKPTKCHLMSLWKLTLCPSEYLIALASTAMGAMVDNAQKCSEVLQWVPCFLPLLFKISKDRAPFKEGACCVVMGDRKPLPKGFYVDARAT